MLAINHTRKRTEKENFPVSDSRVLASSHLHSFLGWSQGAFSSQSLDQVLSYIWELIVPHSALCFVSHWRSFVGGIVFFDEVPVVDELSFLEDMKKIFFLSFPFSPLFCYCLLSWCL